MRFYRDDNHRRKLTVSVTMSLKGINQGVFEMKNKMLYYNLTNGIW